VIIDPIIPIGIHQILIIQAPVHNLGGITISKGNIIDLAPIAVVILVPDPGDGE